MVHSRAFSGAAEGLRQRDCSAIRGDRLCRQHAGACARGERAGALLVSALTVNVKLPITHVEASQKALEQLRQSSNVNRAPPGKPWWVQWWQARPQTASWTSGVAFLRDESQDIVDLAMGPGIVRLPYDGRLVQQCTAA